MTTRHYSLSLAAVLLITTVSAAVAFNTSSSGAEAGPAKATTTPSQSLELRVPAAPAAETATNSTATTPADSEENEKKVLLLTIRPNGFEPGEISLPAGEYLVVVRNRSGLDEFSLRLERETGEVLREAPARRFKRDWKQMLRLAPGTYVIRETNHSDWICRITITAR